MKLLFMGVSATVCCMFCGLASSGSRRRVSHIEALDTTACKHFCWVKQQLHVPQHYDRHEGWQTAAVAATASRQF